MLLEGKKIILGVTGSIATAFIFLPIYGSQFTTSFMAMCNIALGLISIVHLKKRRVSEPKLPELDEAFLKRLGVKSGNINDLHAEIRKNLERELERVVKGKLKNEVFTKLIEQNTLEIPKALIEREAKRIHDELHPHHAGQDHNHSPSEMAEFTEAAVRNVALGLLVGELIKQHKLAVNKAKVEDQIADLAAMYENPAEVAKWYASNKEARAQIEMQVLEDQLIDKLLENVQVTDKLIPYNELITAK